MSSEEDRIKLLSHAVLTEAQQDAEATLTEARQKADTVRLEAESKAAEERDRILKRADMEAERIRSQAIASANLKARNVQLEQRESLLNEVFKQAIQRLPGVQEDREYKAVAIALLKDALGHLGANSATIRADSVTMKLFTPETIEMICKEIGGNLELGEPLEQGTGLLVETPDGHRQYDNTLETRLKRMQDSLRNPVYRLLMGESL